MSRTRAPDGGAAWLPLGPLRQGSTSRQPTGDLRDPFFSPSTQDRRDYPSPTHSSGQSSQYNNWGYQKASKDDDEDYDSASLTVYSPTAQSFRRRSTYDAPPPKAWYSFNIPHPFPESFETPPLFLLLLHAFFCALTYPALYFTAWAATGRSLFWARVVVGAGCGLMGFALSITILELAQAHLEASTWATLIHMSNVDGVPDTGMRLRDLCVQANESKSIWSAVMLIWNRRKAPGARSSNKGYFDGRWWTGYIILFACSVLLAACLPFIFGRTVDLSTMTQMQNTTFEEVLVSADLSPSDLEKAAALLPAFTTNTLFTWTLEPPVHGGLPTPLALQWENETVYFSEVTQRQLLPNGTGFGTFDRELLVPQSQTIRSKSDQQKVDSGLDPGAVLSFPRWGIRIRCEPIPNFANNLIPFSSERLTYLFTPRETVAKLFSHFNLQIPEKLDQPLNVTKEMKGNDTLPSTITAADTMLAAAFWANGVAINMKSTPVSTGADGRGFATLENVLIRLNNSYAPQAAFPYLNPNGLQDQQGKLTYIGYDGAICLELYEPWIVNVYNSSVGPPTTISIASKVDFDNPQLNLPPSLKAKLIQDPSVKRNLNSSILQSAYVIGHENSVNQIIKDNGRDSFYVPSPTLVSFTGGSGPEGYTSFSPELYANSRAIADASNVLPYFAGSGKIVARRFKDKVVAIATLNEFELIAAIGIMFAMGLVCGIFIPRLPLGVPQRGFNLYSWILAFHAKEVEVEGDERIVHGMSLDHLQDYASDATLRYRVISKPKSKGSPLAEDPEDFIKYRR